GVSLLIDETACEEAAVYMMKANCVAGFCWLHMHHIDPALNNYQFTLNITASLKEGTVHLGKELTVCGAHIFSEDRFYPLLVAPTCKQGDTSDMEHIFKTVMDAWHIMGADSKVGRSFATDGDSTRRKGGHKLFMSLKIPITSPLYGILSNMPGINLLTSPGNLVTLDFDYKHVFKSKSVV
ncbi:hypothetical protein PAXINDRAFT_82508, partial [Paxillus involutus ATCC 200175]